MKLTTKRLILRDIKPKDAKDITEGANNLNVSGSLLLIPYPYSSEDAKCFINHCSKKAKEKQRKDYEFGIELKSEKKIVGMIGLTDVDEFQGTGTIGYWIGEKYWRQGIASESLKEILSFAFNKLKLRRLEAGVYVENEASVKLLKKFNFKLEGTKIKGRKSKATGKIHDEDRYALLK